MNEDETYYTKHEHIYYQGNVKAERRTWVVVGITASMMIVEIAAGLLFNSMADYADGLHMSTHAFALGITGAAYPYARRQAGDDRFAFGPWKVEALGGYTSAIILVLVALAMIWQSIQRVYHRVNIHYAQALGVAIGGLVVIVVSAIILREGGGHARDGSSHKAKHVDLNLKAAYLHVLADATTSILAIVALSLAGTLGVHILDPIMGMVGGIIICVWGRGLLRDTSRVLLDREMDRRVAAEVRGILEMDGSTRIDDLHVWRIGAAKYACAVSVVTASKRTPEDYRKALESHDEIVHTTIEVAHRGG